MKFSYFFFFELDRVEMVQMCLRKIKNMSILTFFFLVSFQK